MTPCLVPKFKYSLSIRMKSRLFTPIYQSRNSYDQSSLKVQSSSSIPLFCVPYRINFFIFFISTPRAVKSSLLFLPFSPALATYLADILSKYFYDSHRFFVTFLYQPFPNIPSLPHGHGIINRLLSSMLFRFRQFKDIHIFWFLCL